MRAMVFDAEMWPASQNGLAQFITSPRRAQRCGKVDPWRSTSIATRWRPYANASRLTWRELSSPSALHRLPRIRRKLPAPGHDHDHGCRHEQHPRADEPAEIAERKEERTLTA